VVLLHPKKKQTHDPAIAHLLRVLADTGYGSVKIGFLFSRAVQNIREIVQLHEDGISVYLPVTDAQIVDAAKLTDKVIVAWGDSGQFEDRDNDAMKLLRQCVKDEIYCFGTTRSGSPKSVLKGPLKKYRGRD
jgi:hypothetical protein